MSIIQKVITIIIKEKIDAPLKLISVNAARNEPPLDASIEKKFSKCNQNFQVSSDILVTPIAGMQPKRVAAKIPIITAPLMLKCERIAITIKPNKQTRAGPTATISHEEKGTKSITVPSPTITKPAFARPIKAMNKPIPTEIAFLIDSGIALYIISLIESP